MTVDFISQNSRRVRYCKHCREFHRLSEFDGDKRRAHLLACSFLTNLLGRPLIVAFVGCRR